MSDFLSREAELLGGDFTAGLNAGRDGDFDIDVDRAASAFPDIGLDGEVELPPSGNIQSNVLSFDDFDEPPRARFPDVQVTGDDELDQFENQFPDLDDTPAFISPPAVPPLVQQPSIGALPFAPRPQPSAFSSTPLLQEPLAEEVETEVIRQWREKQAADIKARDDTAAAKRQETILNAERAIDKFYDEYAVKKERNIKENKQQEEVFREKLSDSLSIGTTWLRICDLVDLENSQSKTLARNGAGTTDLTRMKQVLLRLRREGDAAPGAAGY